MKHFTTTGAPPPNNGLMLVALSGPHDVGRAASTALEQLMRREETLMFAEADPDGLFIYNHLSPALSREQHGWTTRIDWPRLQLHHSGPGDEPGPIFLSGHRPHMGLWGLCRELGELAKYCGVQHIINVTSGFGERPHTRPTTISAMATLAAPSPRMEEIVQRLETEPNAMPLEDAFLVQTCLSHGIDYLAVCGHVPRYLGESPNYQVAADLARQLLFLTRSPQQHLEELEQRAGEFRDYLQGMMASENILSQMARMAEEADDRRMNRRQSQTGEGQPESLENVRPDQMADEVDQYLRREGRNGENGERREAPGDGPR